MIISELLDDYESVFDCYEKLCRDYKDIAESYIDDIDKQILTCIEENNILKFNKLENLTLGS